MNALLPEDIWVVEAVAEPARFHPRYDAISRSYLYRVGTAAAAHSPFHARWCWALAGELDGEGKGRGAAVLPGDHSFLAFAKAGQEDRGDRCIVQAASWHEWPPLGLELRIAANRFLHHMVRYLVGTMVEIGLGRRPVAHLAELLEEGSGLETSPPAPPQGLFLTEVRYRGEDGEEF